MNHLSVCDFRLVMPGLVPGIYVLAPSYLKDVDGRDKPGHDEEGAESDKHDSSQLCLFPPACNPHLPEKFGEILPYQRRAAERRRGFGYVCLCRTAVGFGAAVGGVTWCWGNWAHA